MRNIVMLKYQWTVNRLEIGILKGYIIGNLPRQIVFHQLERQIVVDVIM